MRRPTSRQWRLEYTHNRYMALSDLCALSLNIDSNSITYDRLIEEYDLGTDDKAITEEFRIRLRELEVAASDPSHFSENERKYMGERLPNLRLSAFSRWAVNVAQWAKLPPELVQLAQENDSGENERNAESGKTEKPSGIDRRSILAPEWPLTGKFNQRSLGDALSEVPRWLEPARVMKGTRGSKGSALWNPAQVAICLVDKGYAKRHAVKKTIAAHFSDWLEEWERTNDYP